MTYNMVKILLVEDNVIDAFIAEKVVGMSGADVRLEIAEGAEQALKLLMNQYRENCELPDLILVDQYMPILDGMQFLDAFAALDIPGKEKIVTMMLTNSADPHLIAEAMRRGAQGLIAKPITIPLMTELITRTQPKDPGFLRDLNSTNESTHGEEARFTGG